MAKLKRSEVKIISEVMKAVGSKDAHKRFGLGLTKNKNRIKEEVDIVDKLQKDLSEFEENRLKLCARYVDRNKDGTPVIEKGEFKGVGNNPAFRIELIDLKNKYDKLLSEVDSILNEEIEIDFYPIDFDHFPDIIKPNEVDVLTVMIKDLDIYQDELEKAKARNLELEKRITDLEQQLKDSESSPNN